MQLTIDSALRSEFPGLAALLFSISNVHVENISENLESFKIECFNKFRSTYDLETLKNQPLLRAYRDFFWRVGIDPTKIRPASEALLRRVLQGKDIPRINTLVDAYNLASMESMIALAVFDSDKLVGNLNMRKGIKSERFLGIGMKEEEMLTGKEVIVEDGQRLVAIYPYRDAEFSKVTLDTENVSVLVCGVPGITPENLENSKKVAENYITRFCGGSLV